MKLTDKDAKVFAAHLMSGFLLNDKEELEKFVDLFPKHILKFLAGILELFVIKLEESQENKIPLTLGMIMSTYLAGYSEGTKAVPEVVKQ